jgi:hypothetical protein
VLADEKTKSVAANHPTDYSNFTHLIHALTAIIWYEFPRRHNVLAALSSTLPTTPHGHGHVNYLSPGRLVPRVALALNATLQHAAADNVPPNKISSPAQTLVFICLADILVASMWLCRALLAKNCFRES